jgi:hypothetical protein
MQASRVSNTTFGALHEGHIKRNRRQTEAVDDDAQDLEQWAAIQRDGQSSSVAAPSTVASAALQLVRMQQLLVIPAWSGTCASCCLL